MVFQPNCAANLASPLIKNKSTLLESKKAVNRSFTQLKEGKREGGSQSSALLQRKLQTSDGAHGKANLLPGKHNTTQFTHLPPKNRVFNQLSLHFFFLLHFDDQT